MRVSVPGLPQAILSVVSSAKAISPSEAVLRLAEFLGKGNVAVLTGAGVSVDSGIRAYRGNDGRYMNPNYKLRSYLGYPPVRDAQPNTTHFALAALLHTSVVSHIVTQNVDGLHQKALCQKAGPHWDPVRLQQTILELHGTLHRVQCRYRHSVDRDSFQDWLSTANPNWKKYQDIENSDRILIIGTTLATYSAYRLLKHALELKKPVMLLNVGPTRADGIAGVVKIDMASGIIMRDVAQTILGSKAVDDPIVAEMLRSGIFKPPPMEHE
ncbi:hypothetical protein C0995_016537 [Termitomyces sp. Mi166|nr:hypothetical protein C0995_016537 [Termitomyces sp. Mi166\